MAWNGVIELEEAYGVAPYYPGSTDGFPPGQTTVKFLTTQPATTTVFLDSKFWLWFFINRDEVDFSSLKLHINYFNTTGGGGITNVNISGTLLDQDIICANVSPGFIVDNTGAVYDTLSYYTVQVWTDDNTPITEMRTYYVNRDCKGGTDLLFTTALGGIAPIPVYIEEKFVEQTGTEICLEVPCVATRSERSKWRGRQLTNIQNTRKFTYRVVEPWSEEMQEFFADFKRSSQRWVRVQDTSGEYIPRKLFIEPGGIQVFKDGETIELLVQGSYNFTPAQSINEPLIFDF